jgi:hypothetical protein
MATIANLVAKLTGNTLQFENKFEKVGKGFTDLQRRVDQMKAPFSKFKALLAAVGIFAAGAYVKGIVDAKLETLRFSRMINDSVGGIDTMKTAIRNIGGDTNAAQSGLGKLVKTLADATTGGAFASDTFKRLGLDARELSKLPPSEAFWIIAKQLSTIEDAGQRAAMAAQIFGDDAAALLPILSQGSDALAGAEAEMKKFGGAANDVALTKLELANIEFEKMYAGIQNSVVLLASEFAPVILAILGDTKQWVGWITDAVGWFKSLGKAAYYVYAGVNNIYQGMRLLFTTFKAGVQGVTLFVVMALQKLSEAMGQLPGAIGAHFRGVSENLKQTADNVRSHLADTKKDFFDRANDKVIDMYSIDQMFDNLAKSTDAAANNQKKLATAGGAVAKVFALQNKYVDRAKSIFEENQNPLEKFNSQMMELDTLLDAGAISWDTYGRAVAKAAKDLEAANSLGNVSLAAGERRDSSGAVSAINKAKMENEMRNKEKPAERLERLQKQSIDLAKDQLEYTKRIAEAGQNRKVYTIPGR